MVNLNNLIGLTTVLICGLGAFMACCQYRFYRRCDRKISKRLRHMFLTDALVYGTTGAFGLWAFFQMSFDVALVLHVLRVPCILANIYASYSLYMHYREY